jgi:hypothetical protein
MNIDNFISLLDIENIPYLSELDTRTCCIASSAPVGYKNLVGCYIERLCSPPRYHMFAENQDRLSSLSCLANLASADCWINNQELTVKDLHKIAASILG